MKSQKTPIEMRKVLRQYCKGMGSQKNAAKALELSQSHISDMLSGRRDVSEETAKKLGYSRILVYEAIK